MITLICVTFPVEIIFLAVLRGFGWLHFPLLFVVFSVVFFCIAVSVSGVLQCTTWQLMACLPGCRITIHRKTPDTIPMEPGSRSRHVCSAHTFRTC